MKIVRIDKVSDAKRIVAATAKASPGALEALNPHLDLKRLAPGSVLVLPGGDAAAADASTIAAEAMASFIGFAKQALEASTQRLRVAAERTASEESALAAAGKSKAVNAAFEKDPELRKLFDVTRGQAKQDSQAAGAALKEFPALADSVLAELEALAKRLG
jgi:hypothetical protein